MNKYVGEISKQQTILKIGNKPNSEQLIDDNKQQKNQDELTRKLDCIRPYLNKKTKQTLGNYSKHLILLSPMSILQQQYLASSFSRRRNFFRSLTHLFPPLRFCN